MGKTNLYFVMFHMLVLMVVANGEANVMDSGLKDREPLASQLVALVDMSPKFVGAHDKQGWDSLFADDGTIEDPVGAPLHTDRGRFWDGFIANQNISIEVHRDIVDTKRLRVYRDCTLHIKFRYGGYNMQPAIVVYSFRRQANDVKLITLEAHWNVGIMSFVIQSFSEILPGLFGPAVVFIDLLNLFGLPWLLSYTMGLTSSLISGGERMTEKLLVALHMFSRNRLAQLFESSEHAVIDLPDGRTTAPGLAMEDLINLNLKAVKADKVYCSGMYTAVGTKFKVGESLLTPWRDGVIWFALNHSGDKIESLRFVW